MRKIRRFLNYLLILVSLSIPSLSIAGWFGPSPDQLKQLEESVITGDLDAAKSVFSEMGSYQDEWLKITAGRVKRRELFNRLMVFLIESKSGKTHKYLCSPFQGGYNFNPGGAYKDISGAFPEDISAHLLQACNDAIEAHNTEVTEAKKRNEEKQREYERRRAEEKRAEVEKELAKAKTEARALAAEKAEKQRRAEVIDALSKQVVALGFERFINTSAPAVLLTLNNEPEKRDSVSRAVFGCATTNANTCKWIKLNRDTRLVSQNNEVGIFHTYYKGESVTFAVDKTGDSYIDGQVLPNGFYQLKGTYTYETVLGSTSTVYRLAPIKL